MKLLSEGKTAPDTKSELEELIQKHFLEYASYVILDRAIPQALDGLKPVQRRILYVLHKMDDGRFHKVANIVGQTMAYHPHGDASITEALVHLANRGYLIDRQGNFGNILTGDAAAAARYIEARLSPLARETLFNDELTPTTLSYDSRNREPTLLPARIPLLLLQGSEGIAVGMSTKILSHNFVEVLRAEIALIEGKRAPLYPDFPTGGSIDVSEYADGQGKIRVRAELDVRDDKTLIVREICHGTTSESLIRSIDEAAKKGKIKIESIHDYSTQQIEIEIKLMRGQHAEQVMQALYAFTDCETVIHCHCLVIHEGIPRSSSIGELLELHLAQLQDYFFRQLSLKREQLLDAIFHKTLEQLFIEHRIYKKLEGLKENRALTTVTQSSLAPLCAKWQRQPTEEDCERLLTLPIRRISQFDLLRHQKTILSLQKELQEVEKELSAIPQYTSRYLQQLIEKYGAQYKRKSRIIAMDAVDAKELDMRKVKVGIDVDRGFVGIKVSDGQHALDCRMQDKLLFFFNDGEYRILPFSEKQYVYSHPSQRIVHAQVADKKTVLTVIAKDNETQFTYIKRFVIKQFILEKSYAYFEKTMTLLSITDAPDPTFRLRFAPQPKQRVKEKTVAGGEVAIKSVKARGIRIATKPIKTIKLLS